MRQSSVIFFVSLKGCQQITLVIGVFIPIDGDFVAIAGKNFSVKLSR
ncbi:hypothetical protein [[Leptolyngbya] sp. PCC 7376]|nr:hypothetical protein [[Leptolyngbya] sp. PCC 7376]